MGKYLNKEAPNVVTETLFRSLMRSGYLAEVVCKTEATKKSAVWYGLWIIRVVNQDRSFEKLLVPARQRANAEDEVRIREFKTANGLISFMQNIGFTHVNIPLKEGGRSTHVLPADALETDDD